MTKEQTHKALYIVAFFSLATLLTSIATIKFIVLFLDWSSLLSIILYTVIQLVFILSPFLKKNQLLFLSLVNIYASNFFEHLVSFFQYFFDKNVAIASIGGLPGIWIISSIVFMNISGLLILALRSYGYWSEHKAGWKTKF